MFFISMFCVSIFWPGMVLNQGQLSIVVSDWESYLGSLFPLLLLWVVDFVRGIVAQVKLHGRFLVKKKERYAHHAALWSGHFHPDDSRDRVSHSQFDKHLIMPKMSHRHPLCVVALPPKKKHAFCSQWPLCL